MFCQRPASVGNIDLEDGVVDLDIRYGNVKPQTAVESEPLPPETIVVLCGNSKRSREKRSKFLRTYDRQAEQTSSTRYS
jgi:DNA-binding transcriptional LysR family regulator